MQQHNDYLDSISVDPALHSKIIKKLTEKPAKKPLYYRRAFVYAGAMACMAVLIFGIWMASGFRGGGNPDGQQEIQPPAESPLAIEATPPPNPPQEPPTMPAEFRTISIMHVEGAELIEPRWNIPDHNAALAARGANDFAFRLGAALAADIGYDNLVVSPYSVWLPLAALLNATMAEHRPALLDALGASGLDPEDINRAASRMLFDLTNERARREGWGQWGASEESALHIANAIFVDYDVTLRREFAQTFMDYFRGEMINVDFRSPYAVEEVNLWASYNTNGLITEVVQEFDPLAIAAIANAIYFSGRWTYQFDPEQTRRDIFHSPAGDGYAYFMRMEWPFIPYFEDERVQAITLPFSGEGGMTIILPKDGNATGLLASMTDEYFERMQSESVLGEGSLLLPRFSIENTIDNLKDALVALGVPLFDEWAAPLTGGLIEENLYVWVGDAVQVAMIEVDEEGTTAAAVTVMEIRAESLPIAVTTFEMICNTPFVFVLHSRTTDGGRQVLFTGVVNQP